MLKIIIISLSLFTTFNVYADNIILSATSNNIVSGCKIDHRCPINGNHDIQITNNSNEAHSYTYNYLMCVVQSGIRTDCSRKMDNINVAPHSVWNNHFNSHSEPNFGYANTYGFFVETQVIGFQSQKIINNYSIKVNLR